jgi:short-subunit dehydrogenase
MPRTWIITGASRGIGAAIADEAADGGHAVALVARSDAVEEHAAAIRARGGRAIAVREDVTAPGAG